MKAEKGSVNSSQTTLDNFVQPAWTQGEDDSEDRDSTSQGDNNLDSDDGYEVDEERESADNDDIEQTVKDLVNDLSEADRSKGQYAVTKVRRTILCRLLYNK